MQLITDLARLLVRVNKDFMQGMLVLSNAFLVALLAYCQRQGTWHAKAIDQLNCMVCPSADELYKLKLHSAKESAEDRQKAQRQDGGGTNPPGPVTG